MDQAHSELHVWDVGSLVSKKQKKLEYTMNDGDQEMADDHCRSNWLLVPHRSANAYSTAQVQTNYVLGSFGDTDSGQEKTEIGFLHCQVDAS